MPSIKTSNDFPNVWNTDEDIIQATAHFTDELRHSYETALNAFLADDYEHAKIFFNDVLDASEGKDGPSRFLLSKIDRMKA